MEGGEEDGAEALAGGVGGPGAEDWANGAAALSAALAREARVLAQAAAALRAACVAMPGDPSGGGGPVSDVRRQRAVLHAAGEAALRAALALEAAEALHAAAVPDAAARADRIAQAARRAGAVPAVAAPLLRAAALDFRSDDAAARIAATAIAQDIAERLERTA
jgi:hypothetical protein